MDEIQISIDQNDDDALFEFQNYDDFRRERIKLNHDNTLKLWYSLPTNLTNIDNKLFRQQTLRQQRKRFRNFKFFAVCSMILKRTFLKNKIRSRGKFNFTHKTLFSSMNRFSNVE